MALKVKDVIRELKKFSSDYKVSLETYEEDANNENGYKKTNCISVDKDDDADKRVVIK
jgi:hypothetical protein